MADTPYGYVEITTTPSVLPGRSFEGATPDSRRQPAVYPPENKNGSVIMAAFFQVSWLPDAGVGSFFDGKLRGKS
jgi:hypothetical protein